MAALLIAFVREIVEDDRSFGDNWVPRGPQAAAARSAGPESGVYKNGVPAWPPHGTFQLATFQAGTDTRPRDPKCKFRTPTIQSQGMTHVVGSAVRLITS